MLRNSWTSTQAALKLSRSTSTLASTHPQLPSPPPLTLISSLNLSKPSSTKPTQLLSARPKPFTPRTNKIHLRYANNPSELNIRLGQLCALPHGGLDAAIELVRTSSIHVATVSVWTQLLQHIVQAKRFSLVYGVFLDIKRRQIAPDTPFFVTLFAALARCPQSKNVSLDRLRSIWAQAGPSRHKPPIALTNAYLNCLAAQGFVEEAFELFGRLPPSAVDSITLSQMLKPLLSSPTPAALGRARLLFERFSSAGGAQMDMRASLSFASLFLKSVDRVDQKLGAQILKDRLGLELDSLTYRFWAKAKGPLPAPGQATIRLGGGELTTLIRMLLSLRKFALVRRIWAQIVANRDLYLERDALDQLHCGLVMVAMGECGAMDEVEELLVWMITTKEKQLQPTSDTLDKAIQAAWQAEDLPAAIRILAVLSQQYEGLIRPGTIDDTHALVALSRAKGPERPPPVSPSNRALSTLLQTAGKSGKTSDIERALQAVEKLGRRFPEESRDSASTPHLPARAPAARFEPYWRKQYIWVLTDLLDRMARRLETSLPTTRKEALEAWRMQIDEELASSGDLEMRSRIESREEERRVRREQEAVRKEECLRKRSGRWSRENKRTISSSAQ